MTMVRGSNPVWSFVDLSGHQFDDTFYMFVLQNALPYIPATVWHDPAGAIAWTNPIRFFANGTLPIDIYWDPTVTYRLEFRQGPTQADPLIYLVENYMPGEGGGTPTGTEFTTDNQISNPQFEIIYFSSPVTLTSVSTQTLQIAPDWFLDLTGTGNVVLQRISLNNAAKNPTNAPYSLNIQLSGTWTAAFLRQRFQQNGMLWANQFVSCSVTALSTIFSEITGQLYDSSSNLLATVLPATSLDGNYEEYKSYGQLSGTINADFPPNAYIDFKINLLPMPNVNVNLYITSIQLIASNQPIAFSYQQETVDRALDHTFHYYSPRLAYKPIPSYTVGWDFPFNPVQELGPTVNVNPLGADKSRYIADQTIAFEEISGVLSYAFSASTGLTVSTTGTSQFSIIQYLGMHTARELLSQRMCVRIKGSTSTSTLTGVINIYWTTDATLPSVATGSNNSLVATMVNGLPATFNGTWNQVTRSAGVGNASFMLTSSSQDFSLNGFDGTLGSGATTATFMAIVVSFNSMPSSQTATLEYCTLQAGDIPTPPPALSIIDTLSSLEEYYETSYQLGATPGSVSTQSLCLSRMEAILQTPNILLLSVPFGLNFRTTKRKTPLVNLFSPDTGLGDTVRGHTYTDAIARNEFDLHWSIGAGNNWTRSIGQKGFYCLPVAAGGLGSALSISTLNPNATITYQYVADARLGIVL